MLKRLFLTLSIASATAVGAAAQTGAVSVVGVVTKVDEGRIEVRTDTRETLAVLVSSDTRYLKWIVAKPWQQDPRVDLRFIHVGSRVHVELTRENPQTARTVWIVVGRPGFD